jgi:hypothetical protein
MVRNMVRGIRVRACPKDGRWLKRNVVASFIVGMTEEQYGSPTPFACPSNPLAGPVQNPAQSIPPKGDAWDVDFAAVPGWRRQRPRFGARLVERIGRSFELNVDNALE